jgi:hypothetical protein
MRERAGRQRHQVSWHLVAAVLCVPTIAGCTLASSRHPVLRARRTVAVARSAADPGYLAARQQWLAEELVLSSADQAAPLLLAVLDLKRGEMTDTGKTSRYPQVIAVIKSLESLPLTDNTHAQIRRGRVDLGKISRFFHVRHLGSCAVSSGMAGRAAAAQWSREPSNAVSGVAVRPLLRALADLTEQVRAHPPGTSCYPAAIADLNNLKSATMADIAATRAHWTAYAADIAYLNVFFNWITGLSGGPDVLTPNP